MKKNQNSELLNLNVQGYLFQCLDDPLSGYLLEWLDRYLYSATDRTNRKFESRSKNLISFAEFVVPCLALERLRLLASQRRRRSRPVISLGTGNP